MVLKLYNTLTRKKQVFKPISDKYVTMYNCGPTVYWYQHIGNLKAYVFSDLLRRTLELEGYKVKQVINVTDVGHLKSSDDFGADESGEDKMELAAKREGKSAQEIANYYFNIFLGDLKKLNIKMPEVWSKATEHIKEQIGLIKKLEEKGFTYKTSDGIYYDTSKFKDYGKLAKLNVSGLEAGKRVEMREKRNPTDFALWKFSSSQEGKRQQEWNSPWGVGFPGWHIECSAMSMKYLGETIDLHTGGADHIPIHHTNEIAQSEAATGKKFVNYWMHEEFLTFKGEKVSKSKGGLFTITELEERGFSPLVYRYFLLNGSYRKQIDFSLDILENTKSSYTRLKNICGKLDDDASDSLSSDNLVKDKNKESTNANCEVKLNEKYLKEFKKAMEDDLNTPKALAVLWELVRDEKAKGKYQTIKKMDEVFGLKLLEKEILEIPEEVKRMAEQRIEAKKQKNYKLADELREKVNKLGFLINDTKEGYEIKKSS